MCFQAQKKGVRFADLHYPEEVEEDTDSADSFIDATTAVNKANTKAGSAGDGRSAGTSSSSCVVTGFGMDFSMIICE